MYVFIINLNQNMPFTTALSQTTVAANVAMSSLQTQSSRQQNIIPTAMTSRRATIADSYSGSKVSLSAISQNVNQASGLSMKTSSFTGVGSQQLSKNQDPYHSTQSNKMLTMAMMDNSLRG